MEIVQCSLTQMKHIAAYSSESDLDSQMTLDSRDFTMVRQGQCCQAKPFTFGYFLRLEICALPFLMKLGAGCQPCDPVPCVTYSARFTQAHKGVSFAAF